MKYVSFKEIQDKTGESFKKGLKENGMSVLIDEKEEIINKDIIKKGMNVRKTENYIESINQPKKEHARQKTKGYSKNIQIGINTVNQSIKMIEKLGIEVRVDTSETDDQVKMIISFPKK